jgi:hypothetical protein
MKQNITTVNKGAMIQPEGHNTSVWRIFAGKLVVVEISETKAKACEVRHFAMSSMLQAER